ELVCVGVALAFTMCISACGPPPCRGDYLGSSVFVDASRIQEKWPTSAATVCVERNCREFKLLPEYPPNQQLPVALSGPTSPRSVSLRVVAGGKTVAYTKIDRGLRLAHPRCGPPGVPLSTDGDGRLVQQ